MTEGFRRDFDAELLDKARGKRPQVATQVATMASGSTAPSPAIGSLYTLVVHQQPRLLERLLQLKCALKPVGEDWEIEARTHEDQQKILDLFRLNRVHGVKRPRAKPRPGEYSRRRDPPPTRSM